MRFWFRELTGWFLVLVGLFAFFVVYGFCVDNKPIQAGCLTIVGIFVFRGGIHLLKVAVAARVCLLAQDRLYPAADAGRSPTAITERRPTSRRP